MGAARRGRRWAALTGYFQTGHQRPAKEDAQGRSKSVQALSTTYWRIMELVPATAGLVFSGPNEDFPALLRRKGLLQRAPDFNHAGAPRPFVETESTTILAFKFSGGVLVAGDRRATAGNTVVYDR